MFDPEIGMDPRLAAELAVNGNKFYAKRPCHEQELKYLLPINSTSCLSEIRNAIQSCNNRVVDTRNWHRNEAALVTFNLDTIDQKLAKAGFSLRIRFSFNDDKTHIDCIDMCLKTSKPRGYVEIAPRGKWERGEWEIALPNLHPDIKRLIGENRNKKPAIPADFLALGLQDKDLYVETIGATHRNIFPSYERFTAFGHVMVSAFQHTEDDNIFLTPHGDACTGSDQEAEAEFVGFYGIDENDITDGDFQESMTKAMELLNRKILNTGMGIEANFISKHQRSREFLENVYGKAHTGLASEFDKTASIMEASHFALSQMVHPQDILLGNLLHHIAPIRARAARMDVPQDNPFQHLKAA